MLDTLRRPRGGGALVLGAGDGIEVRHLDPARIGPVDLAAWQALHHGQSGVATPFASPTWVLGWYRAFVPADRSLLLWVTRRDRLVGVAPLYVQDVRVGGVRLASRAGLVGSGRTTPLELPPLLAAPGQARAVVRAVARAVLRAGVTWGELSLGRDVWLLDRDLATAAGTPVFARRQELRACVVLPLAPTWDETRSALSRNVKESVRRARNRLAKDPREVAVRTLSGPGLDVAAVDRLLRLHRARSGYEGSASQHHDAFADPDVLAFTRDVVPRLALADEACLVELDLDGVTVAAQLVLRPPGGIYFHSSGFRPAEWDLSPVTALQVDAMQAAVARGDRWVNFSPGPNEAKLRWSDALEVHDEVAFGPAHGSGVARYGAFALAKEARRLRHERRLQAGAIGARRTRPSSPCGPAGRD